MAETSGFFNAEEIASGIYDRAYIAEQFAQYFATFIGNGVFANPMNQLQAFAKDEPNMTIGIRTGMCFINGYWYKSDTVMSKPISLASGTLNRIDAVVKRWTRLTRKIETVIKEGIPSSVAIPPALTRSEDIYEIATTLIYVDQGITEITSDKVIDVRSDSNYCGFVTGVIDQLDVTTMFQRFEDAWNTWFAEMQESVSYEAEDFNLAFQAWFAQRQSELDDWFKGYTDRLGEGEATGLQLQIDSAVNVNRIQENQILGFVKSDTTIPTTGDIQQNLDDGRIILININKSNDDVTIITSRLYNADSSLSKTKTTTIRKLSTGTTVSEVIS